MCCVMGYTGHDLPAEKFKEYLLRTVDRGPDDQRVVEGPYGLMGFGRLADRKSTRLNSSHSV